MLTRAILLIVLLTSVSPAVAQDVQTDFSQRHKNFFYLLEPERTAVDFKYFYEPERQEEGSVAEFDAHIFELKIEQFKPSSENFYLIYGGEYSARHYTFSSSPGARTSVDSETLHEIAGQIGFGYFLSDNVLMTAEARPGIYSNLDGIDEDDFRLFGDGMFVYRMNPGAALIAGVSVSERFEDNKIIPFGGLRLLSDDGKLHINVTIPIEAQVSLNLSPAFTIYGGAWINGDKYNVKLGPRDDEFNVQVHDRRLGGGVTYWLNNQWRIGVEAGASIDSEYEFKLDNAGQFDGDLDTSPYFAARIGFSL